MAGVILVLLPHVLGPSTVGLATESLGSIGWLLVAGGAVLLWLASYGPGAMDPEARADEAVRGRRGRAGVRLRDAADPIPEARPVIASAQVPSAVSVAPRPTSWGPDVLDVVEWRRLEALVEALFRQAGFETRSQSHGADGGVDVWLHTPLAPEKPVGVVQCKHHRRPVGVDKVRELRGVMAAHGVGRGQFVSTAGFTPDALAFGRANEINLLDGAALLALISRRTAEQQASLLAVATEGEFWRPTCARCGIKMAERTARNGGRPFWGCVNYPGCRSTLQVRSSQLGVEREERVADAHGPA